MKTKVSKGHVHYWLPVENGGWACNCGEIKDFGKYNKFSDLLGPPKQ